MSLATYPGAVVSKAPKLRVLTARKAGEFATQMGDLAASNMLAKITACKTTKMPEMQRLRDLSDRFDNLYYPNQITEGGADHWPEDEARKRPGLAHVSVNVAHVYVDIPAGLQAMTPQENILPADPENDDAKTLAASVERVYLSWKEKSEFETKAHKCAVVKGLYGRCAAKVWWDPELKMPQFSIIDQPRNLWLGWGDSDYTRLDWAIYAYQLSPGAVMEEFGLDVTTRYDDKREEYPVVVPAHLTSNVTFSRVNREWANQDWSMIEVHDYWYRKPVEGQTFELGKPVEMETWNAILVGNVLVKDEAHPEYDGKLPYVVVFNSYIPGVPDGRPELYDIEQLLREKDARISAGAALIGRAVKGQYWQLTGAEAPDRVPSGFRPKPDEVIAPGAGNRVESIDPWMPEFQLEQFLLRLDRELTDVSGLNDLLRGMAPPRVLSSGKAITALVANYEVRIAMKRDLYYAWRVGVWELSKRIWGNKESKLQPILDVASRLVLSNPSLTPRDDLEMATLASNLLNQKIWSQVRAMNHTGVEDPEAELQQIREERTDAAIFPADVQSMAALMAQLQQLGVTQQQLAAQAQAQGQPQSGAQLTGPGSPASAADAARLQASGGVTGQPMLNAPGEQPQSPEQPANAQAAAMQALMGGPAPGSSAQQQTMIKGGTASNRILLSQPLGGRPGPAPGGR